MGNIFGLSIGTIISGVFYSLFALAAVIVGLFLYLKVFSKKNDGKYTGFMGRLYDFVNVKKFSIEPLLKAAYIIAALYISLDALLSFSDYNVWRGVGKLALTLVLDNALLRIGYELALLLVRVLKRLDSVADKLEADGEKSEFADVIFPKKDAAPVQPVQQAFVQQAPPVQPVQPAQPMGYMQPAQQVQPVPQPVESVPQPVMQSTAPAQSDAQGANDNIFCPHCGKQISASSKFCPFCGNSH